MSSFIRGTVVLMVAVFLTKLLGFVFRIQFMRIAGEEAVGIYMTAYPAFIFFLSLVQLGVPIAIAKVIAELEAKGQSVRIPSLMKTASFITILTAVGIYPSFYLVRSLLSWNASWQFCFVHYIVRRNRNCANRRNWRLDPWIFPRYCTNRRNSVVTNHRTNMPNCANHMAFATSSDSRQYSTECRLCDGYYASCGNAISPIFAVQI